MPLLLVHFLFPLKTEVNIVIGCEGEKKVDEKMRERKGIDDETQRQV